MPTPTLPPLPTPSAYVTKLSEGRILFMPRPSLDTNGMAGIFAVSALRARDRQIVELCASLCAKYASQRQDDYEGSDYAQGLCDAAEDCAEEIPALLDPAEKETK